MPWKVEFEREAEKELNRIDRQQAKRILKYLFERIASSDDPRRCGKGQSDIRDCQYNFPLKFVQNQFVLNNGLSTGLPQRVSIL